MKRLSTSVRLVAAMVALVLAGCGSVSRPASVSLSVASVSLGQSSLLETSAALTLRLVNESGQPLALAGGVHRLFLNDSLVGRAVSSERLVVPPLGTATQTITVYLENLTLMRKATELSNTPNPRVTYRLESKLLPADERGSLMASATGELDLAALMGAAQATGR